MEDLALTDRESAPSQDEAGVLTGTKPEDRAQALPQLKLIAEFFQATEPHSPVSDLAERAAKWGEMSLDTWFLEIVKDDDSPQASRCAWNSQRVHPVL